MLSSAMYIGGHTGMATSSYVQVLDDDEAKKALVMNNGYFFGLLDRMMSGKSSCTDINTCNQSWDSLSLISMFKQPCTAC